MPKQSFFVLLLPQTSDHTNISFITGELESEHSTHITQMANKIAMFQRTPCSNLPGLPYS